MTGATPPSCTCPKASFEPEAERNSPLGPLIPSDTAITQWPCRTTACSTLARNRPSSNAISGNSKTCGASPSWSAASAQAAVSQPACQPITSKTNTLVEVRLTEDRSNAVSRMQVARYFAAEPKPGEQSVMGRSLSTVLGIPTETIG